MANKENAISIGEITIRSTELSLKELIGIAKAIIQDEVFSEHLSMIKIGGLPRGADYAG